MLHKTMKCGPTLLFSGDLEVASGSAASGGITAALSLVRKTSSSSSDSESLRSEHFSPCTHSPAFSNPDLVLCLDRLLDSFVSCKDSLDCLVFVCCTFCWRDFCLVDKLSNISCLENLLGLSTESGLEEDFVFVAWTFALSRLHSREELRLLLEDFPSDLCSLAVSWGGFVLLALD